MALTPRYLGLQPANDGYQYYSTERPFLNFMKMGGYGGSTVYLNSPWATATATNNNTGEMQYLQLDSNGYPTSLTAANIGNGSPGAQTFDRVRMWLAYNQPALAPGQTYYYPPGTYRLKYIGLGTVVIGGDASLTLTNTSAETYVTGTFTVSSPTSSTGLWIEITAVNSSTDNPRDISVVENQYAASFDAGEIFHPNFLAVYANMSCFRSMQWTNETSAYVGFASQSFGSGTTSATLSASWNYLTGAYKFWFPGGVTQNVNFTYGSTSVNWSTPLSATTPSNYPTAMLPGGWANRTPATYVSYAGHPQGVAWEAVFALCQKLGCDAWVNVRMDWAQTDVNSLLALAFSYLGSSNNIYLEPSNEVWNGSYQQHWLAQDMGANAWPGVTYPGSGTTSLWANWNGVLAASISEWANSWCTSNGVSFSRVIPLCGAQTGNTGTMTNAMGTANWTGTINGFTGPASAHHIKGICTAGYWASNTAIATTDATTMIGVSTPLDDFFACMTSNVGTAGNGSHTYSSLPSGGFLSSAKSNLAADVSANTYGIPLYMYEGGPNWKDNDTVSGGTATGWGALVVSANRDSRMGTNVYNMLIYNAANGYNKQVFFSDAQPQSTYGCFGAVESPMQAKSLANTPKWWGLQQFALGA